jgi:hypothetical protein
VTLIAANLIALFAILAVFSYCWHLVISPSLQTELFALMHEASHSSSLHMTATRFAVFGRRAAQVNGRTIFIRSDHNVGLRTRTLRRQLAIAANRRNR